MFLNSHFQQIFVSSNRVSRFSVDHIGCIYCMSLLQYLGKQKKILGGVYYILIKVRNEVKCLVILIVLHNTN